MKIFGWKIEKKKKLPSDDLIEEIKRRLFPPLELKEQMQEDGTTIKFHIDYGIDSNLLAALNDLDDGINDVTTRKTISNVVADLNELRSLLNAYQSLDKDAKYIIVNDKRDVVDELEDIIYPEE